MRKNISTLIFITILLMNPIVSGAQMIYTVQKGDSLWKIAVKYRQGLSEIIAANPQFQNPNLIYPGDKVTIPKPSDTISQEDEVIRLVNIERQKSGLSPVSKNWEASRVARIKSQDMIDNNYFAHNSPTYGTPFQMLKSFGLSYRYAGENIAKGQTSPKMVMDAWMNSSGHRSNILNKNYTQIGVGLAKSENGTHYWTQLFLTP